MKKVLVIEDAAEVANIVAATLRMNGFQPLMATNGHSGIELACKELPDLILCDIHMPVLDGYGTLKGVRENESTATTPFIFLSGMADRPDVRRGMELGADDYLAKPFTPTELMAAVNARLVKREEFERQTEKRLDEVRGNITLALPHELRTPLTGILGLSAILAEDYETITRDGLLDIAQDIHRSAQRLQRLIENFLIYAQLQLLSESDQRLPFGSNTLPIPAETIVGRAARQQAESVGRAADLRCDFQPCALPILGENLNKIVEELVSNALKFSDAGTPVRVATEQTQGVFTLTVTDQGRGMTREQIARIGPHMQFDRRTYEQQGSGLGLVIARRLTELQGGEWSIDSAPGRYTTVRVSFPCIVPDAPAPEIPPPASPALAC